MKISSTQVLSAFVALAVTLSATVANAHERVRTETRRQNLYRPIPVTSKGDGAMTTSSSNYRSGSRNSVTYRPTQHYYLRDFTVSYRYNGVFEGYSSPSAESYFGPSSAVFTSDAVESQNSSILRSYASVSRRTVTGVGMSTAKSSDRR
jgi:hypothetical protein